MAALSKRFRGLGDYLNDTFNLVPRVWKEVLPVSVAAVLPPALIYGAAFGSLRGIATALSADGAWPKDDPSGFLRALAPFFLAMGAASLLQFLCGAYQKAFVCLRAGAELQGRKPRFGTLARAALGRPWLRVAIQDAVIGSVIVALALAILFALFFPLLLWAVGNAAKVSREAWPSMALGVTALYLLFLLAAFAAAWFISVRCCVSAPASLLERRNSIEGIGRSIHLTARAFWRVFGAMFVISLVISFGLGIVMGPITFGIAMPGYFRFLGETMSGGSPSPASVLSLLSSMGWVMGISMLFTGVVQGTLWPSFLTVLYADLRTRKGELAASALGGPRLRGSRRRRSVESSAGGGTPGFGDPRGSQGREWR
jgi:hypothetical protein